MKNLPFLLALHSIDGLGPMRLKAIIDYFKDPKLAWEASIREIREIGIPEKLVEKLNEVRKTIDPESYAQSIKDSGIKWVSLFDDDYPKMLAQIYDPPIVLYYRGEILPADKNAIAVVGTRNMTGYGKVVTEQFTRELSEAGLTIVSGLARGVDAKAHQTAIEEGGRTLAVLGGGLNKIYPPENSKLAENIIKGYGAIISEFPPDRPSLPSNFPLRNRIISGLSLAVLVTEASENSGSLITARLALEQGREVFAVPGPVTSMLSVGPIELIKEGARPVREAEEILQELGIDRIKSEQVLSEGEKKVLECLGNESLHIDEICGLLNQSVSQTSASLLRMEIVGLVRNLGGIYEIIDRRKK